MPDSHQNSYTIEASVPAAGAAVAQDTVLGSSPISGQVTEVTIESEAAVTANGTNYRTLRVLNKGQAGAGSTVVASQPLDTPTTDDLTAYDEESVALSAVAGATTIAEGDVLVFDETVTGTGLAHSGFRVKVLIER